MTPGRFIRYGTAMVATAILVGACSTAGASPRPSATEAASAMASHAAMASETAMASHAAMASETAMASHAAMASETAAAGGGSTSAGMGTFHRVDGDAQGTAALIHLANGSFEITLEDFSISSIDHTNIIIVMSRDVTKSSDVDQATLVDLGPLKATSGMQDFPVPAGASDPMAFHTVVLWDTTMKHAIAAAPLK